MTMIPKANPNAATKAIPPKVAPAPKMGPAATVQQNEPGPAAATVQAEQPAATATTTAVAAPRSTAVSTRVAGPVKNYIDDFKKALEVEWNTLHRIQVNQGNFLDMEDGKKPFATEMKVELLSWQDSWQVSPGSDDAAAKELVRYSNDGKTTTDGHDVYEYLQALKDQNWEGAKIGERCTLVLNILETSTGKLVDTMVQIDLSPQSKAQWKRYQLTTSFDCAKKGRDPATVNVFTMRAVPKSGGERNWTIAEFDMQPLAECLLPA